MAYADYDFYKKVYRGTLSEDDFIPVSRSVPPIISTAGRITF